MGDQKPTTSPNRWALSWRKEWSSDLRATRCSFEGDRSRRRKRSTWIFRKLGAARTTVLSFNSLEFVSGDSIRYLCRCYRLRIVESEQTLRSCKFIGGWLELTIRLHLNETKRVLP